MILFSQPSEGAISLCGQAKLSSAQQELMKALQSGVRVYFIAALHSYYFRSDGKRINYSTVTKLLNLGLVKECDKKWNGHKIRLTTKKELPKV